jgi:hypothetical protein
VQSDDQFRLAFEAATARLDAWTDRHRDCAHVTLERVGHFWRLSLTPHAANACAVELILHRDTQSFDIQFGPEAYEAQPIDTFDLFEPLLNAVVAGGIVTRQTSSAAGARVLMVETVVQPEDRVAWIGERRQPGTRVVSVDAVTTRDRHWVPYRRG